MSKRKSSVKERWQNVRKRYTWHLRPPFDALFDRSHWWKGQSEVEPVAALYELVRRHPLVGAGLLRRMPTPEMRAAILAECPDCPPPTLNARLAILTRKAVKKAQERSFVRCTCPVGLSSWAKLDPADRSNWRTEIGSLKGLDFRWDELLCRSINELSSTVLFGAVPMKATRSILCILALTAALLLAVGCLTSAKKLAEIHLDMNKAAVTKVLGKPTAARGSIRNKYGEVIEVWEYVLDRGSLEDGTYWLYFHDDKLAQWGAAGEWRQEADRIYEVRFGNADNQLTK